MFYELKYCITFYFANEIRVELQKHGFVLRLDVDDGWD